MTRQELQRLAEDRALDGAALRAAGRHAAAYYLLGYAVECGLKACVARATRAEEFPDRDRAVKAWTHNFKALVDVAGLKAALAAKAAGDKVFEKNWDIVCEWSEASRYNSAGTAAGVARLQAAVHDPTSGVLTWIRSYW